MIKNSLKIATITLSTYLGGCGEETALPVNSVSPNGRILEKFTRSSNEEIIYQFTVEDTNLYKQPWTAELSFYPLEGRIYEYACHEGNYSMPGILAGARRAEREQASN